MIIRAVLPTLSLFRRSLFFSLALSDTMFSLQFGSCVRFLHTSFDYLFPDVGMLKITSQLSISYNSYILIHYFFMFGQLFVQITMLYHTYNLHYI